MKKLQKNELLDTCLTRDCAAEKKCDDRILGPNYRGCMYHCRLNYAQIIVQKIWYHVLHKVL